MQPNEIGYLAILDTHMVARWYMLPTEYLCKAGEKEYPLFELRIHSDKNLSKLCSRELYEIVEKHKDIILRDRYSGLVKILKQQDNEILFEED
jgi:hypothetical protein